MNFFEDIKRTFKYHGLKSVMHIIFLRVINKFATIKILRCAVLTDFKLKTKTLEDASPFKIDFLDDLQMSHYFQNGYNDLAKGFLDTAVEKNDKCVCAFDPKDQEGKIAGYSWFSNEDTSAGLYDLDFAFDPDYIYTYKVFTDPLYRGRRLHAKQMNVALKHFKATGFKGIVCHIYSDNFDSLKSSYRMGFNDIGSITIVKIFGKVFHFTSKKCAPYKVCVRPRQPRSKNKVLIIAMNKHWSGISRLPSGLDRAGFITYALCPKGSFLALTKYLKSSILFPTFTYSRSKLIYLYVCHAILRFRPDIIVPGDEEAILALQNLRRIFSKFPIFYSKYFVTLINQSLTAYDCDSIVLRKSRFLEYCHRWSVKVPQNIEVNVLKEALSSAAQIGYPVVLKRDISYGGSGVYICQNERELEKNFTSQINQPLLVKLKYLFKNLFFISIFNEEANFSIQEYVQGSSGHISFCAVAGKVMAANAMLGLHTYPGPTGACSVSRGINNSLLIEYARIVAQKLIYNGFGSLDFIFNELTNSMHIIELNARPTPASHFSSQVVTNDLCEVLYKSLNQEKLTECHFKSYTVAMFPNEKKRDPESAYLKNAYHDVPVDDDLLMDALENF